MSDVEYRVEGHLGRITLNRPKAINAITHEMVISIRAQLNEWRTSPEVKVVLIEGAGERLERLQRRADAVAQQQRQATPGAGTDRDAQRLRADSHRADPFLYAGHGSRP